MNATDPAIELAAQLDALATNADADDVMLLAALFRELVVAFDNA
jgi:hypothetical protein